MEQLRKLIREHIESLLNLKGEVFQQTLKNKIEYLREFEFIKYKESNQKEAWIFTGKNGFAVFKILIIHLGKDNWKLVLNVKDDSTEFSEKLGKKEFGPFYSFINFVEEVNKSLNNNLLWGTDVFQDDINDNKDKIVIEILEKLLQKEHELMAIQDPNLDRLKKVFAKFKELKNRMKTEEAIAILVDDFKDYDNLIWVLQDADKIDFYNKLKKF